MPTNLIMILVNPALREQIIDKIATTFPELKIRDGTQCFTVTEGD